MPSLTSWHQTVRKSRRALGDGEVLAIGRHRLRFLATPHVPHGWDAGLVFDETEKTLFCSDLFFQPADTDATLRRLAALGPRTLAVMHGSSFTGDGRQAILDLATVIKDVHGRVS